jgi:hypothetical protein
LSLGEELIDRITDEIRRELATVNLPSPAYAVALDASDGVYPVMVSIGLEEDRAQALSSTPADVRFDVVFDAYAFPIMKDLEEDPETAALVKAAQSSWQAPEQTDGMGIEGYVLAGVARRLTLEPPLSPVTEDFVAFVFFPGADELIYDHLVYSTPPEVLEQLRAKGVLPSKLKGLAALREYLKQSGSDDPFADRPDDQT